MFIHADMSIAQLEGCSTVKKTVWNVGRFRNVSLDSLIKVYLMIKKYSQDTKL